MGFFKNLLDLDLIEEPVMPPFGKLDDYDIEQLQKELKEDQGKEKKING